MPVVVPLKAPLPELLTLELRLRVEQPLAVELLQELALRLGEALELPLRVCLPGEALGEPEALRLRLALAELLAD